MPVDWQDKRLCDLLLEKPKNGYSPSEAENWTGVLVLGLGCLGADGFTATQLKNAPRNDPQLDRAMLKDGDVLISRSNTRNTVGYIGIFEDPGTPCAYPDLMMRLHFSPDVKKEFVVRYLQSRAGRQQIQAVACGTSGSMVKLNRASVESLIIPLPGREEQRLIAEILDTLDEAIRKTEQLIAKLKLVKQGLLHDLLTRGIDENGELRDPERHPEQFKDSPLGRIPREWEVADLGLVLSGIDAGWSPLCIDEAPGAGQWGVLKVSAVTTGDFLPTEAKTLPAHLKPDPDLEIKSNDVVLARANGVAELVGVTAQAHDVPPHLMLSDKLLRLRPNLSRLDINFSAMAMNSAGIKRQIAQVISGSSGQKNISQAEIRALKIRLPRIKEQVRIADSYGTSAARIRLEAAYVGKLRLLKTGLMDDLLTGRVRVNSLLEGER